MYMKTCLQCARCRKLSYRFAPPLSPQTTLARVPICREMSLALQIALAFVFVLVVSYLYRRRY
jgi:hypothetical protein